MMEEIRSLRTEMGALSDHIVRLRYADIKCAFLEQIRMAAGEEGRKAFLCDAPALSETSQCLLKSRCLRKLEETVDLASERFMGDDVEGAMSALDDVEDLISGECSSCQDGECSRGARETIRRVRAVLQVYDGLISRLGTIENGPATRERRTTVTPELAESVVNPLANAWRIKTLTVLRRGDHSLSELGRAVDLRTGHLQFHLRALIAAGYVGQDRRKHLYRITERGDTALEWTEDLARRLGPLVPGTAGDGK